MFGLGRDFEISAVGGSPSKSHTNTEAVPAILLLCEHRADRIVEML